MDEEIVFELWVRIYGALVREISVVQRVTVWVCGRVARLRRQDNHLHPLFHVTLHNQNSVDQKKTNLTRGCVSGKTIDNQNTSTLKF